MLRKPFARLALVLLLASVTGFLPEAVWAMRSDPLPPSEQVQSSMKSVEEAMPKKWISAKIPIPPEFAGKLEYREDLKLVEIDAIRALIDDKSTPNSEKRIRAVRYTLGDSGVKAILIEAKQKGIKIDLTFDPNPVMVGAFKKDETFTTDVKHMRMKPGTGDGETFLGDLMKAGFELGKDLVPEPLYNPELVERTPIMHEKALIVNDGKKSSMYLGSENWAPHDRINEMVLVVDPDLITEYDAHVQSLIDAYRNGKETSSLPPYKRTERVYKDGSSAEFAFTNGRYNPNDRATETAADPSNEKILYSQFALTNRRLTSAIIKAMKEHPELKAFGAIDSKFFNSFGFGVAPTLSGYSVNPPLGPSVRGAPMSVARRVESFVFRQRAIDPKTGEPIISVEEDGIPVDRVLLHTKVTMFLQKAWAIIYQGSFNGSSNVANAEYQLRLRVPRDSWHAKTTEYWIRTMVKSDPASFVRTEVAAVASELAHLMKVSDIDVPASSIEAISNAFLAKRFDDAKNLILALADTPSGVRGTFSREKRIENLTAYNALIDFYVKELPPWNDPRANLIHLFGAAQLIANPKLNPSQKREIVDQITWRPDTASQPEVQEANMQKVFDLLKFGPMPPKPPRRKPGPRTDAPEASAPQANPPKAETLPADLNANEIVIFDFDDTILKLSTRLRLYKKGSSDSIELGSTDYAREGANFGKSGPYADYEVRRTEEENTFVHFGDATFAADVKKALAQPDHGFAPAFELLVTRLSDPELAKRTYLLTARSHPGLEIEKGLQVIADFVQSTRDTRIFIPPVENFMTVGGTPHIADAKAKSISMLATKLKDVTHIVFYDDDAKNIAAVRKLDLTKSEDPRLQKLEIRTSHVESASALPGSVLPFKPRPTRLEAKVQLCKEIFPINQALLGLIAK